MPREQGDLRTGGINGGTNQKPPLAELPLENEKERRFFYVLATRAERLGARSCRSGEKISKLIGTVSERVYIFDGVIPTSLYREIFIR